MMRGLGQIPIIAVLTGVTCAMAWGNGGLLDFAGAPNLILNPGFESDAGGVVIGQEQEAHFGARGDGLPDEWECQNATLDTEIAHSGRNSIRLSAPGGSLASTHSFGAFHGFSGFVEHSTGGIRPGGVPVLISVWSRAENVPEGSTYRASCNIASKAYVLDFTTGTHDWEQKSLVVVPEEDFPLPEVTITFQAPEGSGATVWFDDIYVGQLQPYPNLAVNAGFEQGQVGGLPTGWGKLPVDYLAYWGGYYWPGTNDELMSHSGRASLRCDAASGQTGGAAQTVLLRQEEARPIIVGAYCRAENLVAENPCWLAVDTWYDNGKRELETARVFLGKAGHDWDYRTLTIIPKRPVDHIVLKVENRSSLRTSTVWVDDLYVAEVGSSRADLRARGLRLPVDIDCFPLAEGSRPTMDGRLEEECWQASTPVEMGGNRAALAYDEQNLYIALSTEAERMEVMLSPFGIPAYDSIDHISFYRFGVSKDGTTSAEAAIDQDGYVFYLPADLSPVGWEAEVVGGQGLVSPPETRNSKLETWTAGIRIPFAALGMNLPSPGEEWLINIAAVSKAGPLSTEAASRPICLAADYDDFRNFGKLTFSGRRELELSGVSFGEGLPDGLDMSQTWITKSDVRWGENVFRARLTNTSASLRTLTVQAGPSGSTSGTGSKPVTASVEPGRSWEIGLPYTITSTGRQELRPTLKDAESGETMARNTYPVNVPPPIQLRMDQFFYYPDETQAQVDVACPYLPSEQSSSLRVRLISQSTGETLLEEQIAPQQQLRHGMDISSLPISAEPVREYRCQVDLVQGGDQSPTRQAPPPKLRRSREGGSRYGDGAWSVISGQSNNQQLTTNDRPLPRGATLASASTTFGRLQRPKFPPLPPVEEVEVGPEGALLVNGKPFFPIIASLRGGGPYARASEMGFNSEKDNIGEVEGGKARIDDAWKRNVYFVVSDTQSNAKDRDALTLYARDHPGVLIHVGSEVAFEYGGLFFTEQGREMLRRWEEQDPKHPRFLEYEGGCGAWYARSLGVPPPGNVIDMNAFIRAGPLGRVVPRVFDLERAATTHPEVIQVVETPFPAPYQEGRFDEIRAAVYLGIIHGARGLYYYDPAPTNRIDQARGLVLELRALSPILFSPATPRTATLVPARNHVDVLERKYEGKTYLITCNRSEEPQQVEFRLPNLTTDVPILRHFEPLRPIERSPDGKGFKDTYGPYEVHVYEIGWKGSR